MLTKREIELVQNDWQKVVPMAEAAATLFYDRLFSLDPSLKPLFKSDLGEQKKKLMGTIGVAVKGLGDLGALVPTLQALGKKHVGYGVKPEHYQTVGTALLWTLEKGLGNGFDAEHVSAWGKVYGVLSNTMLEATSTQPAPTV